VMPPGRVDPCGLHPCVWIMVQDRAFWEGGVMLHACLFLDSILCIFFSVSCHSCVPMVTLLNSSFGSAVSITLSISSSLSPVYASINLVFVSSCLSSPLLDGWNHHLPRASSTAIPYKKFKKTTA